MKSSVAFALLSLFGSAYARPTASNSVLRRDGSDDTVHKPVYDHGKDYDYDRSKDKAHYPDNLAHYPNKHCDVRYQNFLDLLFDDVCAKFYEGDAKHGDREYDDGKKHKRDGKDYGRDDSKDDDSHDDSKNGGWDDHHKDDSHDQHKDVKQCDDRADKLLEEACRAYYHYDGGMKHDDKGHEDDKHRDDDGKKEGEEHKDGGKDDDGRY